MTELEALQDQVRRLAAENARLWEESMAFSNSLGRLRHLTNNRCSLEPENSMAEWSVYYVAPPIKRCLGMALSPEVAVERAIECLEAEAAEAAERRPAVNKLKAEAARLGYRVVEGEETR